LGRAAPRLKGRHWSLLKKPSKEVKLDNILGGPVQGYLNLTRKKSPQIQQICTTWPNFLTQNKDLICYGVTVTALEKESEGLSHCFFLAVGLSQTIKLLRVWISSSKKIISTQLKSCELLFKIVVITAILKCKNILSTY
jgi:hypothetical protein